MPDSHVADQGVKIGLSEYLSDQAHIGMDHHILAVGGGDSGALLSSVLQGEETEEGQTAGLSLWGKHPNHPAFFVGVIKRDAAEGKFQLATHGVILCNPFCSSQQQESQF
jgi:hypothetical protein